ncbi:TPA: gluconate 5-dehydrogenase [Yersinia enterocolitica]|uniref:gluconate 5-dehydrogenase n=1 Tax=Yersinia enterocolitica TaxID=630 RepID=UPI003512293A
MRDGFTASLRSACFHRYGHFVNNLRPGKPGLLNNWSVMTNVILCGKPKNR